LMGILGPVLVTSEGPWLPVTPGRNRLRGGAAGIIMLGLGAAAAETALTMELY
jgi:hypothetical protein